jgi:Photosynthesis system II assembly factor YCF48
MNRLIFFLLLVTGLKPVQAQQIRLLTGNRDCSLRGLSAVDDLTIWVSGSKGTVGRSLDGGASWKWMTIPRYEKTDFRDIEAFNDREAVIMGITAPSVILKTTDGGLNWRAVFVDSSKGMFLDAMDFGADQGIVVGDPVDHQIFLAASCDRGEHWKKISPGPGQLPAAGEAFFAASGANIKYYQDKKHFIYISGGKQSAFYLDTLFRYPLHLIQGGETTGANAIAFDPVHPLRAVVVGGDFSKDSGMRDNCVLLNLEDLSQQKPTVSPHGYRSSVAYIQANQLVSCGTSGVDISTDNGMNWIWISRQSFHVCGRSKNGSRVFFAGAKGLVGVLEDSSLPPAAR